MQERFGIAAFRSRQQALKLEAALKKGGPPRAHDLHAARGGPGLRPFRAL